MSESWFIMVHSAKPIEDLFREGFVSTVITHPTQEAEKSLLPA